MPQSELGISILLIIFQVFSVIASGLFAWNWLSPQSFFGAILFIVLWGLLSRVFYFILAGLMLLVIGED